MIIVMFAVFVGTIKIYYMNAYRNAMAIATVISNILKKARHK
jgi:purine-cytosine permease-like protein